MSVEIFALNYRGFKELKINLEKNIFLIGDNSSGKSSILHLIEYVFGSELMGKPVLNEKHAYDRYDFFSPYFDYSDVTIGFISRNKKEYGARVITFKRGRNLLPPTIVSSTVILADLRFSLRRRGSVVQYKIERLKEKPSLDTLSALHFQTQGYRKALGGDIDSNAMLTSLDVLMPLLKNNNVDQKDQTEILEALVTTHLDSATQTGPLRGRPERFYSINRTYQSTGAHFAAMWHDLNTNAPADHIQEVIQPVIKFGRESQLFDEVHVEKLSRKLDHSPLLVTVQKQGRNFLINQMGIGVSQVMPIVIDSLFRKESGDETLMLLQQPELHLHPVAQAALGEFLFNMAQAGCRYVIETHSDFLIDRFRANMRDAAGEVASSIFLCENKSDGNHLTRIEINKDGELENPPESYKDFFVNELLRTMF